MTNTPEKYERAIQRWIDSALKKMGAPSLVGRVHWEYNPKLTASIGRAIPLPIGKLSIPMRIEFSPSLFEKATQAERRETVYHEVAHFVDMWNGTYHRGRPHGKSWKSLMHLAGVPATRCHNIPLGE